MTIDVQGAARIDPLQRRNYLPEVEVTPVASNGCDGCLAEGVRAAPGIDAESVGKLVLDVAR